MGLSLTRFLFLLTLYLMCTPPNAWAEIDQDYPSVKIQTLDKATARTNTVVVDVGQTVEFGSLFIKVQACRKSGPLDQPESAAFLQIWEVPLNAKKSEWIFSGWMFASSPALSAMDHPVYDVWVLDCAGGEEEQAKFKGTAGDNIDMATAQAAARQCGLNILRQIHDAVESDWSRVKKCVKLGGFVNCTSDYNDMSLVINAASDLMVEALGEEKGKHARFAVGAPSLPAGFCVEIDAVFEIES